MADNNTENENIKKLTEWLKDNLSYNETPFNDATIETREPIPEEIAEILGLEKKTATGSDGLPHEVKYSFLKTYRISNAYEANDIKTLIEEQILIDDGDEGVWEDKDTNWIENYVKDENLRNTIDNIISEYADDRQTRLKELSAERMVNTLSNAIDVHPIGNLTRLYADIDPYRFGFPLNTIKINGDYRLTLDLDEYGNILGHSTEFLNENGELDKEYPHKDLSDIDLDAFNTIFKDKALEWFKKQSNLYGVFEDLDRNKTRHKAEERGYFTWDDIEIISRGTAFLSPELKAKDNARGSIALTAIDFGINIEEADSPEEAIEDFLRKHPEYDMFNESGSMLSDEEREKYKQFPHPSNPDHDEADIDNLMNLGEKYGITKSDTEEIIRFFFTPDFDGHTILLTDEKTNLVLHDYDSGEDIKLSLPELIFEARERLNKETTEEEHPWADTDTKLDEEDWLWYKGHINLFNDKSEFSHDIYGIPTDPNYIEGVKKEYRKNEIEKITNWKEEKRLERIFEGMTSSAGNGSPMNFEEMKKWTEEMWPELTKTEILKESASRMLLGNLKFPEFNAPEYKDNAEWEWNVSDITAKKLLLDPNQTWDEIQEFATKDAEKKLSEIKSNLVNERIEKAYETITEKYENYPGLIGENKEIYEKGEIVAN